MDNDFDNLKRQWSTGKKEFTVAPDSIQEQLNALKTKKKSSTSFHYGNILVLSATVIVLLLFFYYLAPVQELPSRIGVGLMIGGLLVRIAIEFMSVARVKKIKMTDLALDNLAQTIAFYKFRKTIHEPVTITIIVLYSIGFYMISPEFSNYFSLWQMILMDGSYIVIAIVLIVGIRKGVKKEMNTLAEIIAVKKDLAAAE